MRAGERVWAVSDSIVRGFRLKCRQYLIDGRGSNRRSPIGRATGLILITGVCSMALREFSARTELNLYFRMSSTGTRRSVFVSDLSFMVAQVSFNYVLRQKILSFLLQHSWLIT